MRQAASLLKSVLASALLILHFPSAADDKSRTLDDVLELDRRLAAIMYRLVEGNASLCPAQMPLTGIVLHARSQYTARTAEMMDGAGWFPEPVSVALVVPGSPAEKAGIRPGDGLLAINGAPVASADEGEDQTSEPRDSAERQIAALAPTVPFTLSLHRNASPGLLTIELKPGSACRTRWEVTFDKATLALSDGDTIQIAAKFIAEEDDAAVSVIAAHELAHTALGHRTKLEAQGVNYGVFTAYGRSGRLIRKAEDEADLLSVHILQAAGYDPRTAVDFWRGPGRNYAGGILRSPTHSSARARAAAIEQEIARLAH